MTLTTAQQHALAALSAARWRIAILLTLAMMVLYFGFILLLAFAKPLLGRELAPGLSLGILFGTVVILASWMLIFPLSFVVGIGVRLPRPSRQRRSNLPRSSSGCTWAMTDRTVQ
jgi:uncharacterized membrane protein (DUF485 family)